MEPRTEPPHTRSPDPTDLAYLTPQLPGVGGVLKQQPEDFLVEEQPLYPTSGHGEHLYLFVEKTGLTTPEVVRRLARAFRVGRGEIGYAGLKDKHAITRQHFSVRVTEAGDEAEALRFIDERCQGLQVLWTHRHENKLRLGHHGGNRFVIRVRELDPLSVIRAKAVFDRLAASGVPNYLGEQRFGYRRNSHVLGKLLLLGDHEEFLRELLGGPSDADSPLLRAGREAYERGDFAEALEYWPRSLRFDRQALDALRQGKPAELAVAQIDRSQRQFLVNALQSAIFNDVLSRRVAAGELDRLIPGDLAQLQHNRAVFPVDEAVAEAENGPEGRVRTLEVSPSGPMWGPEMPQARGRVAEAERDAVDRQGLTLIELTGDDDVAPKGSRRPLRVPLRDPDISAGTDERGGYLRLAFELPRGAFATVVLREIMKTDPPSWARDGSDPGGGEDG